jgi:hypothetical protein
VLASAWAVASASEAASVSALGRESAALEVSVLEPAIRESVTRDSASLEPAAMAGLE